VKLKGDPSSRPLLSLSLEDLRGATVVEGQRELVKLVCPVSHLVARHC